MRTRCVAGAACSIGFSGGFSGGFSTGGAIVGGGAITGAGAGGRCPSVNHAASASAPRPTVAPNQAMPACERAGTSDGVGDGDGVGVGGVGAGDGNCGLAMRSVVASTTSWPPHISDVFS